MNQDNKRSGRESELRKKVRSALERYELTFHKPLTTLVLKEFLDECEKENRMVFLKDRIGLLSDVDVGYLRLVLNENPVNDKQSVKVELDDDALEIEEDFDPSSLDAA